MVWVSEGHASKGAGSVHSFLAGDHGGLAAAVHVIFRASEEHRDVVCLAGGGVDAVGIAGIGRGCYAGADVGRTDGAFADREVRR